LRKAVRMCASEKRPLVCVFIPHPSIVSQGDCCTNPSRATKLPTRPTSALENPITFCSATRAVLAAARLSAPTPAQPAKRPAREETAAGAWRISVTLDDCGIGVESSLSPPVPPRSHRGYGSSAAGARRQDPAKPRQTYDAARYRGPTAVPRHAGFLGFQNWAR
jgi:hypothetical protein